MLNRDGRPSGFGKVQFISPEAAEAARDQLHLKTMDDRYVEVFIFVDRPNRTKQRGGRGLGGDDGEDPRAAAAIAEMAAGVTREQVVAECRATMAQQRKQRMLLSMLGVALSQGVRSYLKQADLGLKHF